MVAAARPLPSSIIEVIQTLRWPLNREGSSSMRLEPLERLAEIRSPTLPTGEDVLSTVALLRHGSNDQRNECWARVATALLLLGHGYCDEAHNLVGPLSYPTELPYYYGPPVASTLEISAAASLAHCLVHRREGPHPSEFGATGFDNSNFWAGAALRCGGEETLPLAQIERQVTQLAQTSSAAAQTWLQTELLNVHCEWNPRPLTELCATVLSHELETGSHHVLHEFAQQAALVEVRVLLQHALTQLGYDTTSFGNKEGAAKSKPVVTDVRQQLPHTFHQALNLHDNHAVVVTTAEAPHRIVHVNQPWVNMCGYTYRQAVGRTFSILQGPDTKTDEGGAMVRRCRETLQPQEAYLVNYTAAGERFINHVTIGPLKRAPDSPQAEFFVGILERVERVPRMACT